MPYTELFLRIVVGALLGGVIGLERDRRGRPAGLRTHMLVALAAATYMVVSTQFIEHQKYGAAEHVEVDVSRIAASIVTGIGFLGGGAIMRTGLNVLGLTTAAGIWLVGAIGMASGGGMYATAVYVTVLGLIALTVLRRFEDKDDHLDVRRVLVTLRATPSLDEVISRLSSLSVQTSVLQSERLLTEDRLVATLEVRAPRAITQGQLLDLVSPSAGLERAKVERAEG
ncbi:MAG TPA: MgtC/SapB family protein [Candidatus Sulfotelmatobacter sp.]|nr:MgtC/SapB family protein [Candidatus Sulfotelmatobacter sp.]